MSRNNGTFYAHECTAKNNHKCTLYVGTYSGIGGPFCGVAKVCAPYWAELKLKMSE